MKTILTTMAALAVATLSSHAALVLSNSFGYADGALVTVSEGSPLGVWITHSGVTGQVDVASGVVNLTELESEDVSISITNALFPNRFTNEILYASFKVNFSALPSGSGTYFAHFRDHTTTTFRCRVFATQTGAASGKFRVGIANTGSSPNATIATDLDQNTEYKLVVRFRGSTNSTLWINPTSEDTLANKAEATDAVSGGYGSQNFSLRQSLASGNGMGTLTFDDLLIGTEFSDVQTIGGPPSISGLVDVSIPANTNTGPMPFVINDVETPVNDLTVAATSFNPTLVPNSSTNLTFGGSGANRTLTVTPAASQQGTALIEVVVTDGSALKATNSFTITVGRPSISAIANQIALTNTVTGPVAFWVNDTETAPGSLAVTAVSSDGTVLPNANIAIQNLGGTNRSITMTNQAPGVTTVTVTVDDGTFQVSTSFKLTAYPAIGVVLADNFSYADGSAITNSSFFWNAHSGTTGQTQVIDGKLDITFAQSEDINAYLTNALVMGGYAPSGGYVFFARFIVNFSVLPAGGGTGEYFAHFKEFGTSLFRARVFATTNGAAPGKFRLGVSNGGFTTGVVPQDLSLNTPHVVISRYNVSTASDSALWVNPLSESSTSAVAPADGATPVTIYSYAFRQTSGIGTMTIDDLKIATSFADVLTFAVVTPVITSITIVGGNVQVDFTGGLGDSTNSFQLHKASVVSGGYANDGSATLSQLGPGSFRASTALSGSQQYYRIFRP